MGTLLNTEFYALKSTGQVVVTIIFYKHSPTYILKYCFIPTTECIKVSYNSINSPQSNKLFKLWIL